VDSFSLITFVFHQQIRLFSRSMDIALSRRTGVRTSRHETNTIMSVNTFGVKIREVINVQII